MAKHLLTNNKSLLIMAGVVDKKEVLELSGYLRNISFRLRSLQKTSKGISSQIEKFTANIGIKKRTITGELESIREEISEIREEVRFVQKAILQLINQLKGSIKAEELERFKKRMDLWSPEHFVTKRGVEKVLR